MKKLDMQTAREIIDFSGGEKDLENLGKIQLEGAVALHNMIADPSLGMGYLADEVGMGKTYVALGVVALMRYFNPSLRVLFICPSRNVQDKWIRDYHSFIECNVKVTQNRIRTKDGHPAAPYVSCRSVRELLKSASLGYYADFFIGKDSFSISLNEDDTDNKENWWKKLEGISDLLPAYEIESLMSNRHDLTKNQVKSQYAKALNYVLPTFDLIVIDEAHNFKHSKDSSHRNRVLSKVLGFEEGVIPRIKNSLLLSATPYDRNIEQLRNQLTLVGKNLLPDDLKSDQQTEIQRHLKRFMVRRLNHIEVDGIKHTRNMYRVEHRTGNRADINLESNEQKLVMALVQKKVGDLLQNQSRSASFQTGMLASFESFAQTAKSETVNFDGDKADKSDAQDRHVIEHIVDSYKSSGLGSTLPHPKMDSVSEQLRVDAYHNNRKQLVFVRRVKSVKELKNKLDDHYNNWLFKYINVNLSGHDSPKNLFRDLYDAYKGVSLKKDNDITEGEHQSKTGDTDGNQPPKNDTFFAWFFRGALDKPAEPIIKIGGFTTPQSIRNSLAAKSSKQSLLLEPNWAHFLCSKESLNLQEILEIHGGSIAVLATKYQSSKLQKDLPDVFRACQLGFIEWLIEAQKKQYLKPLLKYLNPGSINERPKPISSEELQSSLFQCTLFTIMSDQGLEDDLYPYQRDAYCKIINSQGDERSNLIILKTLDKLHIHTLLISLCLRTGHGIVDVYLANIRSKSLRLSGDINYDWILDLVVHLKEQKLSSEFSTYQELRSTASEIDLIVKTNIPEVYKIDRDARRVFISQRLNPVSPVIGATGETSNIRSAQARKFRMPGYPLILISTDVFQEGEDLHTFCDSVVHYGLSNSPVSIEQKTGRVDRVAAISHRNLTSKNRSKLEQRQNDMIQVSFPHVKQSIEQLQVRQVCKDMNAFLMSLQKVSSSRSETSDKILTNEALLDKSGIPPQIIDFLETPYPAITEDRLADSLQAYVKDQAGNAALIQNHVSTLLEKYKEIDPLDIYSSLTVTIKSARISAEAILSARTIGQEIDTSLWTMVDLQEKMFELSYSTHHRVCTEITAKGKYKRYNDVEMLVGGEVITQTGDIDDFFARFQSVHDSKLIPASSTIISKLYNNVIHDSCLHLEEEGRGYPCVPFDDNAGYGFKVTFNQGLKAQREHKVYIYQSNEHCIFLSKAVDRSWIAKIPASKRVEKVINYTWGRNHHTDIIEFYLDQAGDITGRAIHPISSLDKQEFEYYIYVLAVQADRLEYVFAEEDTF